MMNPDEVLGELGIETHWTATDAPLEGWLAELIANQWDINKIAHYLPVYESVFQSFGPRPVRMLEIGVSFGGSLELWHNCFHPDSTIVGIDYNPNCFTLDDPTRRIYVRIGEQQDTEFLERIVEDFGPFDIILDDGSHIPSYTLQSFQYLFLNGLAEGGAYLVEDLHTCYADDCREPFPFEEANDGSPQFVEVVKLLIDTMHAHYLQTPTGDEFSDAFEPGNPGRRDEFVVPLATQLVSSIEVHDAIAVIWRRRRELPRMIRRWSREKMTAVLDADAARFLDEHPHLGEADETRRDWMSR